MSATLSDMDMYAPDPALAWADRVLLRVEVGSTAHGTGLPGMEDYDELGVMAIPWEESIGVPVVGDAHQTIVYRPGRERHERSEAGDYDLVVHSARKFCRLAASGNPSVLMALFGPLRFSHPCGLGDELREMAEVFWHRQAGERFLGYSRAQRERLEGVRGGKHTNRPELVEQFGFDTKYAMHMVRLGFQGIEYMRSGRFTLPIPGDEGELLRAIRRGEHPVEAVLAMADANELELRRLVDGESPAPAEPHWDGINRWLSRVFDWQRHAA